MIALMPLKNVPKKLWIRNRGLSPLIFIATFWLITTCHAGTWRDNFTDDRLNGWTHITTARRADQPWESTWAVEENRLQTRLTVHFNNPRLGMVADFLQLTAFPLQEKRFVVEGISIKRDGGSLGIAIGRRSPPENQGVGSIYLFHTWGIRQMSFDKTGYFSIINPPGLFFNSPIEHLKVVFDAGHFQVFSVDKLVAEFEDATFETIDLLGFMAFGDNGFHGTVDAFVISGPGIPTGGNLAVYPQGKLATTWGNMKRGLSK